MERSIGNFQIPAGSLTVFFVGAILLTLAFNDRVIMPLWRKWRGQQGFSYLQRMGIGLFLSALGMGSAAVAEVKRLSAARSFLGGSHNNIIPETLPISVFLLIPQFFFVGAGEAFIYTGQLDFFITRSPKGMKTMSTGLFLTTLSLGFFLSSFLVSVVKSVTRSKDGRGWLPPDINQGRLDCFYGLLAIMSVVNMGFYLLCATWYKTQTPKSAVEMEAHPVNGSSSTEERC